MLKRLKDNRGATMVIYVVMFVVLLGMAAVAVDTGVVAIEKSRLQTAADAAALAAALELPDTSAAAAAANRYITLNGFSPSDIDIAFSESNKVVSVTASREVEYAFARIFGMEAGTVVQGAKAMSGKMGGAFDYVLFSGSPTNTLTLNGNSYSVVGSVHTNYNLVINGRENTVTGVCEAVGTITVNGSQMHINERIPGADVVDMPDFSETIRLQAEKAGQVYNGDKTFNGSSIDLSEPLYVNGNITINGSKFTGTGFLFATGNITFNGSSVKLSPDDAVGIYSGSGSITVNGLGATIDGLLYAPGGAVVMNGSNQTVHGRVIGKTVNLNGSDMEIVGETNELECLPTSYVKLVK